MGEAVSVGKGYDPHFVERPLLFQELNEAGDLPVELHNHPAERPQAGQGGRYRGETLLRSTRLWPQDKTRPRTAEGASKEGPEARGPAGPLSPFLKN